MAIARAAAANASDCLKPFAIPDKWLDNHDVDKPIDDKIWTPDDHFEIEDKKGVPLADKDAYVPPTKDSPGSGFTVANDLGTQITLKYGSPHDAPAPGVFQPIDLPLPGGAVSSGGNDYRNNIAKCSGAAVTIGTTLAVENGDMKGPTKQGIGDLIDLDKNAKWDSATKSVINSCAQASTPCGSRSPRIVAIPVFDTSAYYEASKQTGNVSVKVVNILGFFIDSIQGNGDVIGYLMNVPGILNANGPTQNTQSGFAMVVQLVR
jgi:hypothetical protein